MLELDTRQRHTTVNIECIQRPGGQVVGEDKGQEWLVLAESSLMETKRGVSRLVHGCGATIMAVLVIPSSEYNQFLGIGGGVTQVRQIPYCPDCEIEPTPYGPPIMI